MLPTTVFDTSADIVTMPTVEHNFEDGDVICLNSDDDDDEEAEIDVGGPEAVVAKADNEDMTW